MEIDAGIEHPFFVYGKGWASCNPDGTFQLYGLKCQRLQVGDICISLKPRETRESNNGQFNPYDLPFNNNNNDFPQNLSRRPNTISTTATSTIPSSRPAPPLDMNSRPPPPSMMSSLSSYPNHLLDMQQQRSKFGIPTIIEPPSEQHPLTRPLSHGSNPTSLHERYANLLSMGSHNPDLPIPMLLPHKTLNQLIAEDACDASARKRRWSAPDNFNDDDIEEQHNALMRGKYSH